MARAIAGGTISFGLVSIPVKLYSATQASAGVSFNMLHAKCGTRLKQQYICPHDNEIVARDEMVKGYEFAKDQYVTFTPEELKALEEKATQTIEIAEFVPLDEIDPVYFDKAYYLGPEKGGEKAYRCSPRRCARPGARRWRATRRAASSTWCCCGPSGRQGGGLVMQQLLYADEVRPFSEVPIADAEVQRGRAEAGQAAHRPDRRRDLRPDAVRGRGRKRIEDDIQRKVEGQEIAVAAPEPEPAQIIDLMEALKASLAQGQGRGGARRGAAPSDGGERARDRAQAGAPLRGQGRGQRHEESRQALTARSGGRAGQRQARPKAICRSASL